ncbi:Replication termination factor 2 [Marasmius tenuissimus]|nr:Replication termination factor 2 [Marasmius tenuissimus]
MGNDGGSIPDRRDLVRTKAKAEQADKANQTKARWFFCALSKRPLQEPIVSCALGKLYNKDAILEFLLDRSTYGDGERICGHIRSLKDVKTLTLTPNPASSGSSTPEGTERARYICPLSLKEMNGSQPFVYILTCGCVFSQAGLKKMGSSSTPKEKDSQTSEDPPELDVCPQCAAKFSFKNDVLFLNPSETEEEKMQEAMERRRLLEPVKTKKSKKRKNADEDGEGAKKKTKTTSPPAAPSTNPSISAASRAVISSLAMEEAKRKANMSDAVKSLYGDGKEKRTETFMTRGTFTRYA